MTDEHDQLLEEANERFQWSCENDKDNRDNYKADLAFVYTPGAQWPDDVKSLRRGWKEPCLEFNQLKQFVAQVVNDQLQGRPGVRVHAAGGEASEDVAEIMQGLIRSIEYESKADDVYKNAFRLAVAGGRGWWRITSEYEEKDGFNQVLCIKPIQDSNTVYADTDYQQPDGSDRGWAFVVQPYTKTEFLRKWPNRNPLSWDNIPAYWSAGKDLIFVADYYRRVCKKRTKVLMSDGAVGWKDEMPEPALWPEGVTIQREREVEDYTVEWYTIAGGQQVLETYKWPGSVIPLVCVAGEDLILEGRRVYQGLTRHARDAQSLLNFSMTQQAIQLALQPRAPWVMAEGQNEGYEAMWKDANNRNWSTLIYKPTTIDGQLAPPPQRTQPASFSEGWDRQVISMLGMIKSTIGMYEQSLGQKGNETSGKAITARERQGDTATFNFVNNWHMGIDLTGRILVEVIPFYYDTERIVSTIGLDETKKMVTINQQAPDPSDPLKAITTNDMSKGRYAVTVEVGPSFATKRQETAERLTELVRSYPQMMEVAADIVVRAQEIPDADILADRLQLSLPPAVQQALSMEKGGQKPPDPAILAQLSQKDQQLQQAAQTMEAMEAEIQKLKSGTESKMAAAQMDAETKRQQAIIDAQMAESQAQRDMEIEVQKAQATSAAAVRQAEINAETALETARIQQETDLKKAIIDRSTKLEIAEMQAVATVEAAERKPEPSGQE